MGDYSLADYGHMVEDPVRMSAYRESMRRHIRPGDVVIDIGTGPGIMAMMACQLGAARVYAIETNGSIETGRRAAARNGFADRIVFHRRMSTELELPERADVLISDLRGQSPLYGEHIPSIADARRRLLKPGAIQLPQRDRLFVGLSRDDTTYRSVRRPWLENDFNLDLSDGFKPVVNSWHGYSPRYTRSVGVGQCWAEVDYTSAESPNVKGRVSLQVPRGEVINGLELWFEAEVCPGIRYNTGPGQPEQVYGRGWLPLEREIAADQGDCLDVELSMHLVDGQYVVGWNTQLRREGIEGPLWACRQSTFHSVVLSPMQQKLMDPRYQPVPTSRSRALRWLLGEFEGTKSVGELAELLLAEHPGVVSDRAQALTFVRESAARYGVEPEAGQT